MTTHLPNSKLAEEYDPLGPSHIANPYAFYIRARADAPVFFSPAMNAWIVCRHQDVAAILKDHTRFVGLTSHAFIDGLVPAAREILLATGFGQSPDMTTAEPQEHARLRKTVSKAFSPSAIAALEHRVRRYADQLIDQFIGLGRVDIAAAFCAPYPLMVTGDLLGIPTQDRDRLETYAQSLVRLLFAFPPAEEQPGCAENVANLFRYLSDLANSRRDTPGEDLVSQLVHPDNDAVALTQEQITTMLYLLFVAGIETIARFLPNALYHLMVDRRNWQRIVTDPSTIGSAIEEALRFDPPGLGVWRVAREDVVIGDTPVPAGAKLQLLTSSANHDERVFPTPEVFDPNQTGTQRHLGFGDGIHICLGAPLARLEARVAIEQLSLRLPSLRLRANQDLTYTPSVNMHGLERLELEWDRPGDTDND
jgi:cytochrome P450